MTEINQKKILIVDDNEANLFSLQKIMEKMGPVIHTAVNGKEALDLFHQFTYSLILLDIQMPGMDGFEVLEKMRSVPVKKYTPVILISAIFTEEQYKLKGILTGAVDFLPKPVNPAIIRAKARVFLELEEHKEYLKTLINELEVKNKQLNQEISRRKKVEKELRKAKIKAEKKSEIQNQVLVNMSHEIRTPVNSILGFADLIADPDISGERKEKYLRYVSNSSQNLLFLIDEILDHSRMEAGEFTVNEGICDLSELCTEIREVFERIKHQQGKSHLSILLKTPEEPVRVITDPQRVRQVMINLVSNAVKYTEAGAVTLGYKILNKEVRFFVADTGIGIPTDQLSNLFQRFKRVETEDSLKAQGTGLGLSISQRIVNLLGGEISVQSDPGQGSEFSFTLPLKLAAQPDLTEKQTASEPEEDPDFSPYTLVIAEDEEMNFLFLQEALRLTGIQIVWAKNGAEAINKTIQLAPDLVLMDVKMPDINGFEAIQAIKKERPGQVVIIQTALAADDKEIKKYHKLFDDMVTKPINRGFLIQKLRQYLN